LPGPIHRKRAARNTAMATSSSRVGGRLLFCYPLVRVTHRQVAAHRADPELKRALP